MYIEKNKFYFQEMCPLGDKYVHYYVILDKSSQK
jgi:hypothetical protein